jgi:ERCC4-related helicase
LSSILPVGNGKSYAIIQTIKRFYDADEEYLIFVASPFVSLVEQYCQSIEEFAKIPKAKFTTTTRLAEAKNPTQIRKSM